jgi:two-component system phosphate regulon response regulator PhoB
MLTAKSLVDEKELALDGGADDYLTKPFDYKELLARVRALLRRPASVTANVMKARDIELDPVSCRVTKGGEEVHLRPKVYAILEFLMRHPNQLFTADALLARVWLDDSLATPDTIRTHMKLLRKSLQLKEGDLIRTVRHKGYMLVND